MSTNEQQRKFPTPADLDPTRPAVRPVSLESVEHVPAAEKLADKGAAQQDANPTATPADVAPAVTAGGIHRVPVVELSREQRLRVEALHAARRVLGAPRPRDGQLATGWAWQAIGLADYILTGDVDRGPAGEEPSEAEAPDMVVDLDKPLPAGIPPQVAVVLQRLQGAFRPGGVLPGPLPRVERAREYVKGYLGKPEGLKELNAQGFYPVEGSEPPRSEPLHDVHCRRWTFNTSTNRWDIDLDSLPRPLDGDITLSGIWGPALAESGPFHVCI